MNVLIQSNSTTTSYPQPFWKVYSLGMWGVGRSILGFRIVEAKHENRRSYSELHVSLFVACYVRWNIINIQIEMEQTLCPSDLMRDFDFCSYSKFLWSMHSCKGWVLPPRNASITGMSFLSQTTHYWKCHGFLYLGKAIWNKIYMAWHLFSYLPLMLWGEWFLMFHLMEIFLHNKRMKRIRKRDVKILKFCFLLSSSFEIMSFL